MGRSNAVPPSPPQVRQDYQLRGAHGVRARGLSAEHRALVDAFLSELGPPKQRPVVAGALETKTPQERKAQRAKNDQLVREALGLGRE